MKNLRAFAKWGLVLAPAGSFAYFTQTGYFGNVQQQAPLKSDHVSSEYFQQYIKDNNLVAPVLYKNYQRKYRFDHFFEKAILKDIEGLGDYNLLVSKPYHDSLMSDLEMSHDDRLKLNQNAKIHVTFNPNSKLQGHEGVLHGGLTATLLDNVAGCLAFLACDLTPAVTAYLNINYQKPMSVDQDYVAVIEVDKIDGRKVYIKGQIVDKDNNVYTSMDTLYVKFKWENSYIKQISQSLLLDKSSPSAAESQLLKHPEATKLA